jgi:hypothetical protein
VAQQEVEAVEYLRPAGSNQTRDNENRRRYAFLSKQWISVMVNVAVSVVESDRGRRLHERLLPLEVHSDIVERKKVNRFASQSRWRSSIDVLISIAGIERRRLRSKFSTTR